GGPPRGSDNSMSFIFLTESQITPHRNQLPHDASSTQPSHGGNDGGREEDDPNKSYEMERITKLFEILSARSDIDHPVCVECTDVLMEEMQKKLEATNRERDAYVTCLK